MRQEGVHSFHLIPQDPNFIAYYGCRMDESKLQIWLRLKFFQFWNTFLKKVTNKSVSNLTVLNIWEIEEVYTFHLIPQDPTLTSSYSQEANSKDKFLGKYQFSLENWNCLPFGTLFSHSIAIKTYPELFQTCF